MRLIGSATLLVLLLAAAQALNPFPAGLTATHFSDPDWASTPVRSQIDPRPSTDRLFAAWRGSPPQTFSTTWRGSLITLRAGTYTFSTTSDDGSWLYVNGQLVVDNGGQHEARTATGTIRLERGVHAIFIRYFQDGGGLAFDLAWARDGGALTPVPSWGLTARSLDFTRFAAIVVLRRALTASLWIWFAAVAFVVTTAAWRGLRSTPLTIDRMLLVAGAVILFAVLPHEIHGDGRARFNALAQWIEWGEKPFIAYSMVGPLLSAPLYAIGTVFLTPEWWCARFNTVVFLAGVWTAWRLLEGRVDDSIRSKFLLTLIAGSMFPYHLEGYYGDALTATLAGVGLLAVERGYTAAGWTSVAIGVVNTPAALAGLGIAAATQTWDTRRVRHLAPVALAACLILLESWLRRGSPLVSGYEGNHGDATILTYSGRPGFSYPLAFGVLSILFAFGKGIVFYAPGLLLPLRKAPAFRGLWLAFLAGLILVYAKWWAWFGGLFWGPRFFVFASIPASFAIGVWLVRAHEWTPARRLALFIVLTLSSWVAVDGVVFGYSGLGACRDANYEWLCLYVPEFSALWRPFVEWTRPSADRVVVAAYFGVVYAWLAAPLVAALARDGRDALAAVARAQSSGERWRF